MKYTYEPISKTIIMFKINLLQIKIEKKKTTYLIKIRFTNWLFYACLTIFF